MDKQKWALMKLFSMVLKNRAKEEQETKQISPELLKHFSRKELIEIINHIYDGIIPDEYELVDMENEELLKVIGDDFSIISYVTNKWSKEASSAPTETLSEESTKTENSEKNLQLKSNEEPKQEVSPTKKEPTEKGKNS